MKRLFSLVLLLAVLCTLLYACAAEESQIPPLDQITVDSLSALDAQLQGKTLADCTAAWGTPASGLSGLNGYVWYLGDGDTQLIIYFDNEDGTFQHLKTGNFSALLLHQFQEELENRTVEVSFVSLTEKYNQPIEKPDAVSSLLAVLEGGDFQAASEPGEPYESYEGFVALAEPDESYILTDDGIDEFRVGVINGEILTFQQNTNKWFYTCSKTPDFLALLMDLQGR